MESLWMFLLYIIVPVLGFYMLISGIRSAKGSGRKRIIMSFFLFALPFAHSFLVDSGETRIEKSLNGDYEISDYQFDSIGKVVLQLKRDKTFQLLKIDSITKLRIGTWKLYSWDKRDVILTFEDSTTMDFDLIKSGEKNVLRNNFWTGSQHVYLELIQN